MKVSLNLLKEFIDIEHTPEELSEILIERAFEVEGIQTVGALFTNVITARVDTIEKHPNADRLRVVRLSAGSETIYPVVCGASNFSEGNVVALALPGAKIPQNIHSSAHESFTLGKATIRGIESQGMICAAFELGLTQQADEGIWVLDSSVALGMDVRDIVPHDTILTVSLPANRPDLHCHQGIAREIASVLDTALKNSAAPDSDTAIKNAFGNQSQSKTNIRIDNQEACSKFISVIMEGAEIKAAPSFITDTLKHLDIKPVNNIVDITNYVMIKYGQPLHAFDHSAISGPLHVRLAKTGETITALNHKQYELHNSITVIADDRKPLDIAGILGGLDSEIKDSTRAITLTACVFNPKNIRLSSKRLGIRTEASALFEKGVNPIGTDNAVIQAIRLIQQYAGAHIKDMAVIDNATVPEKNVPYSVKGINDLLGTSYTKDTAIVGLKRYGIETVSNNEELTATPPWWRTDIAEEADLAEELIKIEGINALKPVPLMTAMNARSTHELDMTEFNHEVKQFWVSAGYNEVQNYSFVSKNEIEKFGDDPDTYIGIVNPLSSDQAYLKRALWIPLLKNIALNSKTHRELNLFEVGKHYKDYCAEYSKVGGISYASGGVSAQMLFNKSNGTCNAFLRRFHIQDYEWIAHEGKQWLELRINGNESGFIGIVPRAVASKFGIKDPAVWFSFDMASIFNSKTVAQYHEISKFPTIARDISIIIDASVPWSAIESTIQQSRDDLLTDISIVEADYTSLNHESKEFHKRLAQEGKKNYAIRLTFQASDRTLKEAEIAGNMDKIMLQLQGTLGAKIR